jgi:hypothetical protein
VYFADEVRDFGEIDRGQSAKIKPASSSWRCSSSTASPATSSSQ